MIGNSIIKYNRHSPKLALFSDLCHYNWTYLGDINVSRFYDKIFKLKVKVFQSDLSISEEN